MKKLLIGLLVVVLVVVGICFGIKTTIKNEISLKIEELNQNGFSVTSSSSNLPMKIKTVGELQIIDALKAIDYLSNNIKDSEFKDMMKELILVFDNQSKQIALEGTKFDYDFTLNVISKKLDFNIYLSQLSTVVMQGLENSEDDFSKEIVNLIKSRAINLNMDENFKYTLSDISLGNDGALVSLRGIKGDKNSLNIDLFKIIGKQNQSFIVEEIKTFYSEKDKNIEANLSVGNIALNDETINFNIKNLKFDTSSSYLNDVLNTKDKISFDALVLNRNDALSLIQGAQNIDMKNSQMTFQLNNLPYKKYKELLKTLDGEDDELLLKTFDEFFKESVKNDLKISSQGEATSYLIEGEKLFEKLKYDAKFDINKKISLLEIQNLNDVFEKIELQIDLDKASAQKLILPFKDTLNLNYKDTQNDDIKRFELLFKDGFFINGIKFLDEKELNFASNNLYGNEELYHDDENLNFSHELVEENLLKVTFAYKSSLNEDSQKGIVVSFPQLKDKSRVVSGLVGDLKEINSKDANSELFTTTPYEKIKSSYLVVEAYDNKLSENSIKEFSLIIDIKDFENEILEINLRAYSIGSTNSDGTLNFEIVPNENINFAQDEQLYPVKIADIDLKEIDFD